MGDDHLWRHVGSQEARLGAAERRQDRLRRDLDSQGQRLGKLEGLIYGWARRASWLVAFIILILGWLPREQGTAIIARVIEAIVKG